MYEPENENEISHQTEEDSGEYRYGGGFEKEDIYADAHYTPAGESTVPPRYYTPPEPKKTVKREKSGRGGRVAGIICLCLVCAMLGGLVGGGFMAGRLDERVDALEQARAENVLTQAAKSASAAESATPAASVAAGGTLTAAQIYEQACRQVVGITTEVTYTNFFGMNSSSAVSGTGFIVSADGYILTNYHVIELAAQNTKDVNVILHDGTRYTAAIVGYEKYNDIAVLKIDAAVNSGNSGGPVYNAAGEVVGIVTAKYASTGVEGLGFAIPVNDAVSIAGDLIRQGYVSGKAYMGVSIDQRYNSMYAQYWGMPLGAYVYSVESGSCADKAGVREKDIITAIGEHEITGYTDLTSALHSFSAGDTTELKVYRGGEDITLTITFDEAKS